MTEVRGLRWFRNLARVSPVAMAGTLGVLFGALVVGSVHLAGATTSSGDRAVFEPLSPTRILDTRVGTGTVGGSTAPLGPGGAIDLAVTGVAGVPLDATAVVMNLTYTNATAAGFITVWPSEETRPTVSNLNTAPGATQPNLVTVKLGAGGKVSIFNSAGSTDVLADVAGYYVGHNFDDRYYTKTELDARLNALTGSNIVDGSLSLSDLGAAGAVGVLRDTVVGSAISLPAGTCKATLAGAFGASFIGKMVVGTLTSSTGAAVLPNTAAFVPSIVISTTQGGAVPNLTVCNTGETTLTIPAGSVFHWRLIDG